MTQSDEFESALEALPIRLENVNFEGPLDLLLHLIKKNEVNIYDIPIALVTAQYLETIQLMQELDLDIAGEFLVMVESFRNLDSLAISVVRSDAYRNSEKPRGAPDPSDPTPGNRSTYRRSMEEDA